MFLQYPVMLTGSKVRKDNLLQKLHSFSCVLSCLSLLFCCCLSLYEECARFSFFLCFSNKPLFGPSFYFCKIKSHTIQKCMWVIHVCMSASFVSKGFKPLVISSRNCSVPSEDKDLLLRFV